MKSESESRRTHFWWLLLLLLPIALGGGFLYQLLRPSPSIVISPETTYINSPLGPDGLPDYGAYLLARDGDGVTPENNAAVLTWQAMWPGELQPEYYVALCEALGMEVPDRRESLVSLYHESTVEQIASWLNQPQHGSQPAAQATGNEEGNGTADEPERDGADERYVDWSAVARELIDRAGKSPWTTTQIPPLAEWAKRNKKPIDLLVEASQRPRYFSPPPNLLANGDDSLLLMLLPGVHGMRDGARSLVMRAMWHLGEGRSREAWNDLHACYRLARHVRSGYDTRRETRGHCHRFDGQLGNSDHVASRGTRP